MQILISRDPDTRSAARAIEFQAWLTGKGDVARREQFGEPTRQVLCHSTYDVVLLGPSLKASQPVLLQAVRSAVAASQAPVVVLTDIKDQGAVLAFFGAGAADVLDARACDPAARETFRARLDALVARSGPWAVGCQIGNVVLDPQGHDLLVDGQAVRLTKKEFDVVEILLRRQAHMTSRAYLMDALYGGVEVPEPKIIGVFICKIRRKLRLAGATARIRTDCGSGYRFVLASADATGVAP